MTQAIILRKPQIPAKAEVPKTKEEFCIGCGVCVMVCPVKGVIKLIREEVLPGVIIAKARTSAEAEGEGAGMRSLPEFCLNCQRCIEECPTGARTF